MDKKFQNYNYLSKMFEEGGNDDYSDFASGNYCRIFCSKKNPKKLYSFTMDYNEDEVKSLIGRSQLLSDKGIAINKIYSCETLKTTFDYWPFYNTYPLVVEMEKMNGADILSAFDLGKTICFPHDEVNKHMLDVDEKVLKAFFIDTAEILRADIAPDFYKRFGNILYDKNKKRFVIIDYHDPKLCNFGRERYYVCGENDLNGLFRICMRQIAGSYDEITNYCIDVKTTRKLIEKSADLFLSTSVDIEPVKKQKQVDQYINLTL